MSIFNKGFIKIIIFVLGVLFINSAQAAELFTIDYKIKKDDTFSRILTRFLKSSSIVRKKTPMVIKTRSDNPQIKNWKKLKEGIVLKISLDPKMIDEKKLSGTTLKKWKKYKKSNLQNRHWTLFSQFGIVNIAGSNNETLGINLAKLGLKHTRPINSQYKYYATLSFVKFFNVNSSKATESVSIPTFLPELNIGIAKKFTKNISASLNYDLLNYFFVTQPSNEFINIATQNIHRISIRSNYTMSPHIIFSGSVGYIIGSASGVDFSLGGNYLFGKSKKYSVGLLFYLSSLNIEDNSETSNGFITSFGWSF